MPPATCDPNDVRHLSQSGRIAHFMGTHPHQRLVSHTGDPSTCRVCDGSYVTRIETLNAAEKRLQDAERDRIPDQYELMADAAEVGGL